MGASLVRFHSGDYPATSFNPNTEKDGRPRKMEDPMSGGRFNPFPNVDGINVGTFYAGTTDRASALESVFHEVQHVPNPTYTIRKLRAFSLSRFTVARPLKVLKLVNHKLRQVSVAGRTESLDESELISSGPNNYPITRGWAQFFHRSLKDLQGLAWRPRLGGEGLAYVFFGDRIVSDAFSVTEDRTPVHAGAGRELIARIAVDAHCPDRHRVSFFDRRSRWRPREPDRDDAPSILREKRVVEYKEEADELPQGTQASPRWTGAPSIALATQSSEQCIELVCDLARSASIQELPPFVSKNRDLWRLLEPDARQRVAAFPFVIVEFHFQDLSSWREAEEGRLMSSPGSTLYTGVPPRHFEDLALETLLFARQSAREDANVAKAMFAMTAGVATLIASLTLSQIRAIASANTSELKVRWDSDPDFWGELLTACRTADEKALSALRRHAKLLFLTQP